MSAAFQVYEQLKLAGTLPEAAYLQACEDGLDRLSAIRTLRQVYGLDLIAAKSAMIAAENEGMTLSQYQAQLLPELEDAFRDIKLRRQSSDEPS